MAVTSTDTAERVRVLLEPVLAAEGLELVDVVLQSATLQVLVERLEGRIDLDGVAAATRLVDATLDAADPIPGSYTLEVSSPGLERPLRTPAHFRRFVGTTVNVKTNPGVAGDRRVEGILTAADDDAAGGVTIGARHVAYADIERARTVFVFGPAPKPGKGPGPKAGKPGSATARHENSQSEGEQR